MPAKKKRESAKSKMIGDAIDEAKKTMPVEPESEAAKAKRLADELKKKREKGGSRS